MIGALCGVYIALLQIAVAMNTDFIEDRITLPVDPHAYPFSLFLFDDSFLKVATVGLLIAMPFWPLCFASLAQYYARKYPDPRGVDYMIKGLILGWAPIALWLYGPPSF